MPTKEEKEAAKLAKEEEKNRKKAEKEAAKLAKVCVPSRNSHRVNCPRLNSCFLVSPSAVSFRATLRLCPTAARQHNAESDSPAPGVGRRAIARGADYNMCTPLGHTDT